MLIGPRQNMMMNLKRALLHYQSGKYQSQISKDYEVSLSAIYRWIKLYSEVKIDDYTILSAKQIKELQNAMLNLRRKILYFIHTEAGNILQKHLERSWIVAIFHNLSQLRVPL